MQHLFVTVQLGNVVAQLVDALRYKPYDVTGIFHSHNPSGRTVTLGSTQPLTEMLTTYISWSVKAAGALG